jgi:hypothetical protein
MLGAPERSEKQMALHPAEGSKTQTDSTNEEAADPVETAGETTAAATISGPANQRPVGADTMIKVTDAPDESKSED